MVDHGDGRADGGTQLGSCSGTASCKHLVRVVGNGTCPEAGVEDDLSKPSLGTLIKARTRWFVEDVFDPRWIPPRH